MMSLVEGCFHSGTAKILKVLGVMPATGGPGNSEMANGEIADGDNGSCLGLPLKTGQGTIGVLVLGGRWGREWAEAEILLLEVFADHVAEAIAVARLVQDQESKGSRKRLKSLRHELLADVASSLRQPLSSIKGYAESLLNPEVSWPEELRREFLETLGQQTDRLDQVVSDLLMPAQWELGAVMLDPVVFTVKGLLDQAAVDLAKAPRGREVRFRWDSTLSPVLVDPDRMVQVILWLLQAADERLWPGTMLKVEGDWDDGRTTISIGAYVEGKPADSYDSVRILGTVAEAGSWDSWRGNWIDDDLKLVACRHILEGHGITLQVAPSLDVRNIFRFALPPAPVLLQ